MEEVIATHPNVAECAVVGAADSFKGQLPVGFVVLKSGMEKNPKVLVDELVKSVRDEIGAIACFKSAAVVPRLPKTRSGKFSEASYGRSQMEKTTRFLRPSMILTPSRRLKRQ